MNANLLLILHLFLMGEMGLAGFIFKMILVSQLRFLQNTEKL